MLFRGKVVDVARRTTEGFLRGTATVVGFCESLDGNNSRIGIPLCQRLSAVADDEADPAVAAVEA